jgi:hypothetical protein
MRHFRDPKLLSALILALTTAALIARPPVAEETIEGVQVAALDQPRIYMELYRTANGQPLMTQGADATSAIEAFLDTGASGVVLSTDTAGKLGLKDQKTPDGKPIVFEDTGVAGSEKFGVTEPLFVALAPYPNGEQPGSFSKPMGPLRMQTRPEAGILAMIAPGMDIAGMPILAGKVVVIDPTPLAKFDKLKTIVLAPGDRNIPKTTRHVPLTYDSFAAYTRMTPRDATGPNLAANPMIGPDPFKPDPSKKGVIVTYNGKRVSGTFLLDTGAVTSIISTKLARELGVKLDDTDKPLGIPKDKLFSLAIGGLGGAKQSSGIFFDRLELPTREGKPIVYEKAPLLISDVSVVDGNGKTFTLDGVFGMNYLVASAEITGGLIPDVGKMVDGPFKIIVIDNQRGEMGLEPR